MDHPTIPSDTSYGSHDWYYVLNLEQLVLSYIGESIYRKRAFDWYVLGPMYVLTVLRDGSYTLGGYENPHVTTNYRPEFSRGDDNYYGLWQQETFGTAIEVPDEEKEQLVLGALEAIKEGKLVGLSEASIEELQKEAAWLRRKPLITMRAMLKREDKKTAGRRRKTRGRKRRTVRKRRT